MWAASNIQQCLRMFDHGPAQGEKRLLCINCQCNIGSTSVHIINVFCWRCISQLQQ